MPETSEIPVVFAGARAFGRARTYNIYIIVILA